MFTFDYEMAVKHGEKVFMSPREWDDIDSAPAADSRA